MIQTVKKQQNGYLVNGSMYVPNDEANKEYQEVQEWIANGGVVEPEYTREELNNIRILEIKSKASALINSKYPLYKQINTIRNGGIELELMSAYIDDIRNLSNLAEIDGSTVNDIDWSKYE